MGFFDKLKQGLTKTKESINDKINNVFSNFRKVDEELLEELEEALEGADLILGGVSSFGLDWFCDEILPVYQKMYLY